MSKAYMRPYFVNYVLSTVTYMSSLKAQYILNDPFDPLIFFSNLYQGKMSINTLKSNLKLFTSGYTFYPCICCMIKLSKINSGS